LTGPLCRMIARNHQVWANDQTRILLEKRAIPEDHYVLISIVLADAFDERAA
jgi:hypothetical protein